MTIAFIGGGNMAASLIGGLIPKQFAADQVTVFDINDDVLNALQAQFQVDTAQQLQAVIDAEVIMLAVKPQVLRGVCEQLAPLLGDRKPLFISIAAGIRSEDIDRWLGSGYAMVRAMPNTPALLQQGATGLFANKQVTESQRQLAQDILQSVGLAVWVNKEDDIDVVTAISGSGPAYFFMFIESLQKAATKLGLDEQVAKQLSAQTALGAAMMAQQYDDIEKLRNNVTSKGGTTEQALLSFMSDDLALVVDNAVNAAYQRSGEMADEWSGH